MHEKFRAMCQAKIPRILKDIKNRNIYIWGAGTGANCSKNITGYENCDWRLC